MARGFGPSLAWKFAQMLRIWWVWWTSIAVSIILVLRKSLMVRHYPFHGQCSLQKVVNDKVLRTIYTPRISFTWGCRSEIPWCPVVRTEAICYGEWAFTTVGTDDSTDIQANSIPDYVQNFSVFRFTFSLQSRNLDRLLKEKAFFLSPFLYEYLKQCLYSTLRAYCSRPLMLHGVIIVHDWRLAQQTSSRGVTISILLLFKVWEIVRLVTWNHSSGNTLT